MNKKFTEMNNGELFSVLTGSYGIMPQMLLKDIISKYKKLHGECNDLSKMVRDISNN